MKHVDNDFTKNDADLIFTKAKAKGKQRITLDQYKTALELCAKKKFPVSTEPLADWFKDVPDPNAKSSSKKKKKKDGVYDRLTDTSGYTGVYAERFDKDGKGKGLAGADSDRTKGLKKDKGILDGAGGHKATNLEETLRKDKGILDGAGGHKA